MIDLHLHTTASDGRCTPRELVSAAQAAGIVTLAVADHDTVGALDEADGACRDRGLHLVPGIEITSARGPTDVHVLGYFFDRASPPLLAFLEGQRADRVRRVVEMIDRLRSLGVAVDVAEVIGPGGAAGARAVGRPMLARALVRLGHVSTTREAFDRYLAEGRAAYVARRAPSPEDVVGLIHAAGGLASLAHPALLGRDEWIPGMVDAGLDALEAYYSEHSAEETGRYLEAARSLGLAVTGGSDYHGSVHHGPARLGETVLPDEEFQRLLERTRRDKEPSP